MFTLVNRNSLQIPSPFLSMDLHGLPFTNFFFYQARYLLSAPNPKIVFRSNKSLHLFETHYAFLPLFNPNLDFLQSLKVTKSGHHLLHDRTSKGYGPIPGLKLQTSLHACLQRLTTMQVLCPLLAWSCNR